MKKLLIALLALSPMAVSASDDNCEAEEAQESASIYLGGWSIHAEGEEDKTGYKYNNSHDLIAIEYKNIFLGTMNNSYHRRSYVAGYGFDLYQTKYADFKLLVGGVHGYKGEENPNLQIGNLNAFISPVMEVNTPYIQPTIMLFGSAVTLTFKYEF